MKIIRIEFRWLNNDKVFWIEIPLHTDEYLYTQLIDKLDIKNNNKANYKTIREFFTHSQEFIKNTSFLPLYNNLSFQLESDRGIVDVPIELFKTSLIQVEWLTK